MVIVSLVLVILHGFDIRYITVILYKFIILSRRGKTGIIDIINHLFFIKTLFPYIIYMVIISLVILSMVSDRFLVL